MDMSVAAGKSGSGADTEPSDDGPAGESGGSAPSGDAPPSDDAPPSGDAPADESGGGVDAEPSAGPARVLIKVSRAGRDLRAAIAVSVVLGAAIIASLLTVRHIFIGITAIAIALGTWELAGALHRGARINVTLAPLLVGGQAMVWLAWPLERQGLIVAFVLTVLICLVWRFRGGVTGYVRDVTASFFVAAYVPLFAGFATMLATPADGADDQPEEILGGLRRIAAGRQRRQHGDRAGRARRPVVARRVARRRRRPHRHRRRSGRVDDQARPRDQGHGVAAARPR